jgi:two-component system sensor histidine kinase QseC
MLLALPLLGFGLWIVVGRGLSPLQRLAQAVEARAPLDTVPIADADAPAEVRPLLDRLNALFARTGESIARERRFIGDASHELRTPVAAIRAQAQVAQGARDDAERQRALAGVIAGCDRMTALTEQLLMLSRLEAGVLGLGDADAPLRACTEDVIAELAPAIRRAGATIESAVPADLRIGLGPQLAHSVLRNLIDNALRHGGDGVRVRIAARRDEAATVLDVADDGPGIPPERHADALQRFHRLDAATGGGAGLGLAIVGRIAEVCGGTLTLGEGLDGRGLGVRLRVPDRG